MTKFISCKMCDNGILYNKETDTVTLCSCKINWKKKEQLLIDIDNSNLPLSISEKINLSDYTIDDYIGPDKNGNLFKIKKYIKDFELYKRRHLFFSGTFGTQKSTLARYIGKELLKRKKSVYYILADTLIKELILADRNSELKAKYDRVINYDLFIIDEFSEDKIATYQSGWQLKFLLPYLKRRLEIVRKSTIFISNSPVNNIGKFFEGATQELVNREIADTNMIFKDNYHNCKNDFDIDDLWK